MRITRPFQMLIVVVALVAAACTSGTTATDTGSAEVVGADSGVQITGDVSEQYPFLNYVTNDEPEALHPGEALFVLVDEAGVPLLDGPEDAPAWGIKISVWVGVASPFETTIEYGNYEVDASGSIVRSADCSLAVGNFLQVTPNRYVFQGDTRPEIQGGDLAWERSVCSSPGAQQAATFADEVEIEFGDDGITWISSDGTRWNFRQILDEPERNVQPVETTTTIVETTTTTTVLTDSSFGLPGVFSPVECVQTGWLEFRTTFDWQPDADAEPVDLEVGVVFPAGGDQAIAGGETTLRLDEPGLVSWEYAIDLGLSSNDIFSASQNPTAGAACIVMSPELDFDAIWVIEEVGVDLPDPVGDGNTSDLSEFLTSIDFSEDDDLLALAFLEDAGGFALFDEFALVEGMDLELVSASRLDECTVIESTYRAEPSAVITQFVGCDEVTEDAVSPTGAWSTQLEGIDPGDLRWFDVSSTPEG